MVCRALGLPDPRSQGSGNPGATNVLRIGGKKAAAVTLLGDVLKGLIPVLLAELLGLSAFTVAATGLAAFLGHLYPIFFGFRGGKGVATAFGAMLGMGPLAALIIAAVWLVIARVFKVSSLAALTAALLAPVLLWWFALPLVYVVAVLVMAALLIVRHRSNIQRLLAGTESQISNKT